MAEFDPENPPMSAFDDEDLRHVLNDARRYPDRDPQWLAELEAEDARRP